MPSPMRTADPFMTAGLVSDYIGAAALLDDMPKRNGYWVIAATTPTDLEALGTPKAYSPSSRACGPALGRSDTTSGAIGDVAASPGLPCPTPVWLEPRH